MGRNTISIVQYVWFAPCINCRRTIVDSSPLQLRGAVTVGGAIVGGSLFGSGLLRALWCVIGQLYSVLSWFRGSQCVAKLPCTASSHCCFVGNARARVTPITGECRGDGLDRMWYQCSAQLHSLKHHCHNINATLHHCTRAK